MTQRQIPHAAPLPPCPAGHPARHIHDLRAAHAGGGHFVECQCRHTARHEHFAGALSEWLRMPGRGPTGRADRPADVVQFPLPLGGTRR